MQQKDIIYIDVEDDITAIIGKVKNAKEKIVALVPPKRTGVLQSAVNLKLLARAAESANKRLVLVTHNAALTGLAAAAEIPVAKNLQSRPEIPKVPTNEGDDEDVIDGKDLPVGEHAGIKDADDTEDVSDDNIKDIDIDGEATPTKPKRAAAVGAAGAAAAAKVKNGIKVPDFGSFRKKLAIGVGAGVLLILFLIWANVIAPHATIIVSAKTVSDVFSNPVTLGPDQITDGTKATLKDIKQSDKETQSVDFTATGKKNVGDKATGTVNFSNTDPNDVTIPVGAHLTSSDGLTFVANSTVTVPAATLSFFGCGPTHVCPGTKSVGVTAAAGGSNYNGQSGNLSGVPSSVTATFASPTSGGTDKTVTVVTQQDVDTATGQLADANQNDIKDKLKAKFDKGDIVIDGSFNAGDNTPTSSPAVGAEAPDGKAKLTSDITYTMVGIAKDEMDNFLDAAFGNMIQGQNNQKVYGNGLKNVKLDDYKAGDKTDSATLSATAQIGPKINEDDIKQQAKGKRAGEIIGDIKQTDGVSDVQVNLSPFWVQGVPGDVNKISVEFTVKDNG